MRVLSLFIIFVLLTTACQQSVESRNKIIVDSVMSRLLNGTKPEWGKTSVDSVVVSRTKMISQKEMIRAQIEQSAAEIKYAQHIVEGEKDIINGKEAGLRVYLKENNPVTIDTNEFRKEEPAYRLLASDSVSLTKLVKYQDSLSSILADADTLKKINYLSLVRVYITNSEFGKKESDIWIYMDNRYNIVHWK